MPDMTNKEAAKVLTEMVDALGENNMLRYTKAIRVALNALSALTPKVDEHGCWHCWNIEAHKIEYVTAVKDKGGRPMNTPVDVPYRYCPSCGRKLGLRRDA